MENVDIERLAYLSVLAATLTGTVLISRRGHLGKLFRQAGIWFFIFATAIVGAASVQDIHQRIFINTRNNNDDGTITIARAMDGHFRFTLEINGQPVEFLIDTGASDIVLNRQDAALIGFNPAQLDYWGTAKTANGTVGIATVRLARVKIGGFIDRNIRASVSEGSMATSLLGMRYLKLFNSIEIKDDKMILKR